MWGFLLIALASPLGAGESLAIKVSPAMALAPATLFVRASIEPHADNRSVEVVVDSEEFYRSSLIQLEGELRAAHDDIRAPKPSAWPVSAHHADSLDLSGQIRFIVRYIVNVVSP